MNVLVLLQCHDDHEDTCVTKHASFIFRLGEIFCIQYISIICFSVSSINRILRNSQAYMEMDGMNEDGYPTMPAFPWSPFTTLHPQLGLAHMASYSTFFPTQPLMATSPYAAASTLPSPTNLMKEARKEDKKPETAPASVKDLPYSIAQLLKKEEDQCRPDSTSCENDGNKHSII